MSRSPRAAAAALAILTDRVVGEPPTRVHPLVGFGTLMRRVEQVTWADRRTNGVLYTATGVAAAWSLATALARLGDPMATWAVSTIATGGASLEHAAARVAAALDEDDLDGARAALPWLVGRDPSGLDVTEICRAVIESVAENTVDAVIAPASWATLWGARGAAIYRAVNTMDAMVGHRTTRHGRFGWSAARLDDVANLIPARLTAVLVALCRPRQTRTILRAVRTQSGAHPSPNSGVAEAAFAAALDLSLGGPSRYGDTVEVRPTLGFGHQATPSDITRATTLARDVDLLAATIFGVAGLIGWFLTRDGARR